MNSLKSPQFVWPVRVYYEDTDAGGVVYHSNYLNFMERARTEWLRDLGFEQTDLKSQFGAIIVIHSLSINYKSPARFNDLLQVSCACTALGRSSIEIAQNITRADATLVEAHVRAVFVNADTFKPMSMPNNIKQAMEQI